MATQNKEGTSASARDQLNGIVKEDMAKDRVALHVFDPDASPQQKGAAAGKARDQVKSVTNGQNDSAAKELAVDSGKPAAVPTINVKDVDRPDDEENIPEDPSSDVPGAIPEAPRSVIPDWYRVGWRAVSGIDAPPSEEGEEKDKEILGLFLSEQFYGSWYHNAALIFFAVFASHFLTRFHFGWGWLFLVLAACNTYYSTSMSRVRRRARDDIQRELVKIHLASEHETADWINNFLDRFWLIYEPVLSQTVVSSVDQILSTNTPPFLDSLRLTTFTLGTKAPRIDKVRTFPKTADDIVLMDWGLSFTPNDISDLTPKQAAVKVNPKIVLSVRVGKGLATAAMPILLEDITFSGLMRIRLKLMANFPHIQVVDMCFLEKPAIDFVLKPLGGDTFGLDINHIPGLSDFIQQMTHATLGPKMYDPNVFTINLEQLLSGTPLDAAIGVLQVTVHSARSLKGVKLGGGSPDPYVGLSINERQELAHTKYKRSTFNPTWAETKFLLVNSLSDSLVLTVYDYNDRRKDSVLGTSSFALEKMKDDARQEGIEAPVLKDGKDKGLLRYDVSFYPVLQARTIDGQEELPESNVGIARVVLHQAKDLDHEKSLTGELNPFAKVLISGTPTPVHTTPLVKHTNNPIWESSFEYLCSDKSSSVVTVKVIDDRDFLKDPLVGYMSVRLDDILDSSGEAGRDWWSLSGCKSGKLRVSAEWKPLNMAGSLHGANLYSPPIGVVRLFLEKATDVKNVEAALGGKSDPYVRVLVNNVTKDRTEVVNNNLNPRWDQFVYIPVHSLKETLLLECMDYQSLTKDRSLGSLELHVSELARRSDNREYPYESTGKKSAAELLHQDTSDERKGTLHYVAEFLPALALRGVKFEERPNELQRATNGDGNGEDVIVAVDETPPVPEGVTTTRPVGASARERRQGQTNSGDTTEASSVHTAHTSVESSEPVQELTDMSRDELLHQQSGIIVFNILSGKLAKKARVEVLMDNGYWPAFATTKSRSTSARWDYVGESFVKELDFSQVWLRLDESSNDEKDDIIAQYKGGAKEFLELTLDGPHTFTLIHNDETTTSTVEIEARYVPVPVKLDPRESVNNQGVLRVELLDGRDISGVDRSGKSDPFAVFSLNGRNVFKSQTKKKTLEPEWKENFIVSVPSRVDADFSVEIFDWNQIEQAKSLGSAKIELADIEPFQAAERTVRLVSAKLGEKGQVRIRLMFQPEIIAKSRKATSTFTSTLTQIGGLPIGAGKGVFQGVTGVLKKEKDFFGKNKGDAVPPVPELPAQVSQPVDSSGVVAGTAVTIPDAAAESGNGHPVTEAGTLKVTVVDAKDLGASDIKPFVIVRVGSSEHRTKNAAKSSTPEWNESFTFRAASTTPKLFAWVFDHKTIGKNKPLGETEIDIWRNLGSDSSSSANVVADLREGQGQLQLRLEFDAAANPLGRGSSSMSVNRSQTTTSPSRFTIRGRRPGVPDHDD